MLPARETMAMRGRPERRESRPRPPAAAPATILLVDDDRGFREEFAECFPEYRVLEASDGAAALGILGGPNEIDLVLLDVRLPDVNGLELLGEVKRTAPDAAVVILTGFGSKDTVIKALRGQADDYIEKPFDIEATRGIVAKAMDAKAGLADCRRLDTRGKVERIRRFVQRNCLKRISLKDAAAAVFLSPKYVSRAFRRHAGTGFSEYKLAVKMERAKALLATTGYSVRQLSYMLGYRNPESLIRQFSRAFGLTPARYRLRATAGSARRSSRRTRGRSRKPPGSPP